MSWIDELERLKALFDASALTQQEYDRQKAMILGKTTHDTTSDNEQFIADYLVIKKRFNSDKTELYEVRRKDSEQVLLLQKILPASLQDKEFCRSFLDKAKQALELEHEGICSPKEIIEQGGHIGVVQEIYESPLLGDTINAKKEPFSYKEAYQIFDKILDACIYAHTKGICHGDLRPQHILLTEQDKPQIIGFGVSDVQNRNTTKGQYTAPEQYDAPDTFDKRSDIYALGLVLYQLLTGRLPWSDNQPAEERHKMQVSNKLTPPSRLLAAVPKQLDPILLKALAANPADRYSDTMQLKNALAKAILEIEKKTKGWTLARIKEALRKSFNRKTAVFFLGIPTISSGLIVLYGMNALPWIVTLFFGSGIIYVLRYHEPTLVNVPSPTGGKKRAKTGFLAALAQFFSRLLKLLLRFVVQFATILFSIFLGIMLMIMLLDALRSAGRLSPSFGRGVDLSVFDWNGNGSARKPNSLATGNQKSRSGSYRYKGSNTSSKSGRRSRSRVQGAAKNVSKKSKDIALLQKSKPNLPKRKTLPQQQSGIELKGRLVPSKPTQEQLATTKKAIISKSQEPSSLPLDPVIAPQVDVPDDTVEPPEESYYISQFVPGGSFRMGCTEEQGNKCQNLEFPVHEVVITRPFLMMKSEVTQQFYHQLMNSNPSKFKGCDDCPVENVKWYHAAQFANKLSKLEALEECYEINGSKVAWKAGVACKGWRLPTEAEWEYAARGGDKYQFSGADELDKVAWFAKNSKGKTHPGCGKQENGFGLCDMSGNVREWVWDWKANYAAEKQVDPQGPTSGYSRIHRGGDCILEAEDQRVSGRLSSGTLSLLGNTGFRLVRNAE